MIDNNENPVIESGLNLTDIAAVYSIQKANFHYMKIARPAIYRAVLVHFALFMKPYIVLSDILDNKEFWVNYK